MPNYVPGEGPSPAQIALVGEAPGNTEDLYKRPFIGDAGQELTRMLRDAGIDRKECYATNVFKHKPAADILSNFVSGTDPSAYKLLPAYKPNKFLRRELADEVLGLHGELVAVDPKVVVTLGTTALWAVLGFQKISQYLGTVHRPTAKRPFFVVPTYHPSAVLRNWSFRTTVVANLLKVPPLLGESSRVASSTNPLAGFKIKVNPTLEEVERFADVVSKPYTEFAVDVETMHGQIRTIGFAYSPTQAFVIPFWEPPRASYWPSVESESRAWKAIARILARREVTFIFHNGPYDIQYLWRVHGIPVLGTIEDTLAGHWALEPELPKKLGQLSAIYLDLPEWKTMRLKTEKED